MIVPDLTSSDIIIWENTKHINILIGDADNFACITNNKYQFR